MTNYYEILGVDNSATPKEIKDAYKKMALKNHPDKFQTLSDIERVSNEETFKQATVAYDTLSDPQKRKQYDLSLLMPDVHGHGHGHGFPDFNMNMFNLFDMFRSRVSDKVTTTLFVTLEDAYKGLATHVSYTRREFCGDCNGRGYVNDSDAETCPDCHGTGFTEQMFNMGFITQTVRSGCHACNNSGKRVSKPCRECQGQLMINKKMNVRIKLPAGVQDQQSVVVRNRGHQLAHNMYDDLVVVVRLHPHKFYKRLPNNDLECTLSITLRKALTGYRTSIPFLDGSSIDIDMDKKIIDPCTCLEFAQKGMTIKNRLLVKFDIKFPKSLETFIREITLFEKLNEL